MVICVGLAYTAHYNSTLAELRKEHTDLRMRVGLFDEADAGKVCVVRADVPQELLPYGVAQSRVWRYRLSFPSNYSPLYRSKLGFIQADGPQAKAHHSSTTRDAPLPEPSEAIASISLVQGEKGGEWELSVHHSGGSSLRKPVEGFDIDSIDELVIEELVDFGVSRSFEKDEPICLLRIREKNEALNRDGTKKDGLYRGFVFYLLEEANEKAFNAWADGKTRTMEKRRDND